MATHYEFEWDSGNLTKMDAVRRSGRFFTREEMESVFADPFRRVETTHPDPITGETRYIAYGRSSEEQVISVIFVIRNRRIRIFNVWKTKGRKLKHYHEKANASQPQEQVRDVRNPESEGD